MWKFTQDMKLTNKGGNWKYQNKLWSIPEEGREGNIIDTKSAKVLGPRKRKDGQYGDKISLKLRQTPLSDSQKFLIGKKDEDGWFTITNPLSGNVLTSQTISKILINGKILLIF